MGLYRYCPCVLRLADVSRPLCRTLIKTYEPSASFTDAKEPVVIASVIIDISLCGLPCQPFYNIRKK